MAGIIEVKDQGKLRIYDADNSHYTDIVVPSSVTANRTITLPDSSFTVPTANTVYTHPNHSGEVTSSADGATVIAANVVDEANLKISNTPTNGYMLTAQSGNTGGLTWAAAPSAAITLISTNTLSSAAANVTVSGMDSTYKNYKIIVSGLVPQNDNYNLFARSITGGSINTDDYHRTEYAYHEDATGTNERSTDTDSWKIIDKTANILGNVGGENTNLEMTIFDPSSTSLRTMVSCEATFISDNHAPGFTSSSMFYDSTDALQGVNFIMNNGNISAGTFKLYGIS